MTPHRLGFFDSGLGGLTVLRRVLERHGAVDCVYLGDTARVPYGNRQPDEIRRIASEVVAWLRDQQVTTVVMACNNTESRRQARPLLRDPTHHDALGPGGNGVCHRSD